MPTSNYNNYQISCLDQKKKKKKKKKRVKKNHIMLNFLVHCTGF